MAVTRRGQGAADPEPVSTSPRGTESVGGGVCRAARAVREEGSAEASTLGTTNAEPYVSSLLWGRATARRTRRAASAVAEAAPADGPPAFPVC
ncbi:hypothetical protein [Streptomyces bobili]